MTSKNSTWPSKSYVLCYARVGVIFMTIDRVYKDLTIAVKISQKLKRYYFTKNCCLIAIKGCAVIELTQSYSHCLDRTAKEIIFQSFVNML